MNIRHSIPTDTHETQMRTCPHCSEPAPVDATLCPMCKWRLPNTDRWGRLGGWLVRGGTLVLALALLVNVGLTINVVSRLAGDGDPNGILAAIFLLPVIIAAWPLFLLLYLREPLPFILVYGGVLLGIALRRYGDRLQYRHT